MYGDRTATANEHQVKYVPQLDSCWETQTGRCPGGANYRHIVRRTSYNKLW